VRGPKLKCIRASVTRVFSLRACRNHWRKHPLLETRSSLMYATECSLNTPSFHVPPASSNYLVSLPRILFIFRFIILCRDNISGMSFTARSVVRCYTRVSFSTIETASVACQKRRVNFDPSVV